jgi:small subunit ribosomal protein S2
MTTISLRELLESGVHFGHQAKRWNPKMKPYIFGVKSGVHIIDLQQTATSLIRACNYASQIVSRGGKVLFVGTKRQAQEIIREEAEKANQFHVTQRWLGGTLTNFATIKQSIERLTYLEQARDDGKFGFLTKKEALGYEREIAKLKKSLGGIQEMKKLPDAVFIVDPRKERIAIHETRKLNIPVIAVVDTNCDPDGIDFVIPGNDDALKAIRLFTSKVAGACAEGQHMAKDMSRGSYRDGDSIPPEVQAAAPTAGPAPEVVVLKGGEGARLPEPATAEEAPEAAPEEAPEEAPEGAPEETPEETPEEAPEAAPEEVPEAAPEEAPEAAPEEPAEESAEQPTEETSD